MDEYWLKVKNRIQQLAEKRAKEKIALKKKKQQEYDKKRRAKKKKPCPICGSKFLPRTYRTRFCSQLCRFKYLQLKTKGWTDEMIFSRTIFPHHPDKLMLENEKKLIAAVRNSPDLSSKIPVMIDSKTTIFIDPWKDPDQIRAKYINKF